MGIVRETIAQTREDRRRLRHAPAFAPAGQSTQLIVGASPESDYRILALADRLYQQHKLKRVYYSAYVSVHTAAGQLAETTAPPLQRENRLYQADWLVRLYGYTLDELVSQASPYLDLTQDPKQAFAMRHPALFPVDLNTADREMILKVPGIGLKSANRIVRLRRQGRVRLEHLKRLGAVVSRAAPYIHCPGMPRKQWRSADVSRQTTQGDSPAGASAPAGPARRLVYRYDGTFEGFLSAIFQAYAGGPPPDGIDRTDGTQLNLFEQRISIETALDKADRVWDGLQKHMGVRGREQLCMAFLAQHPGVETLIYRKIRARIPLPGRGRVPASLGLNIEIEKLARKVQREAHRMKGLVRFRQTGIDQYVALIAPRYDILPLIRTHFEARYADQNWIIYDTRRHYGLGFDRRRAHELKPEAADLITTIENSATSREKLCQRLWQHYYQAVNIAQRNNRRLHVQQLPRRYWRYLPEKKDARLHQKA